MHDDFQSGQHLSADQLSAFAENLLPEHERLTTLTHLSACADCRQAVFLAQQADPEFSVPLPMAETPRRSWFSLSQFVFAAGAALACSLILFFVVLHQRAGVSSPPVTTAKLEQPPMGAPAPPAPATPPAANSPRTAPATPPPAQLSPATTHAVQAEMKAEATPQPAARPAKVQSQPPPAALGGMAAAPPSSGFTESKQADNRNFNFNSTAPAASTYAVLPPKAPPSVNGAKPMPEPAAPEDRAREGYSLAAANAANGLPASAPPPVVATGASASSASETVEVTTATDAVSVRDLPSAGRVSNATDKFAAPLIKLRGNKSAASVLTASGRTLALATTGELFVSLDRGKHWTAVTRQWSGTVARISLAATPTRLYLQQPESNQAQTQTQKGGNTYHGNVYSNGVPPQQQAPIPTAGFELTTAAGAVWHSDDGLTWHPR